MNVTGVLPQLREVLREAREDAGANFTQVASSLGKVENVVRRFEKGSSSPAFSEVDALVRAYAVVTGVGAMDLWNRALTRAADELGPEEWKGEFGPEGNEAWQRAKAHEAKVKKRKGQSDE
jgi:hypothetical protein